MKVFISSRMNDPGCSFTTKSWIRQYGDKTVLFTLTHPNNPDKDLDNRTIEEKIEIVHSIFVLLI